MAAVVQNLRTTDPAKVPAGLASGQVAFNLANKWMFVGVGGNEILLPNGQPVASYGGTLTVLGVPNVAVPAKPTGAGYEIFDLAKGGIDFGAVRPASATAGQVFVDTSTPGKPSLLVYSGAAWLPPTNPPKILSLSDVLVQAGAGADFTAKAVAALVTATGTTGITAKADLSVGDQLIVTDGGAGVHANAALGGYVFDGTNFIMTGGAVPNASTTVSGVVKLALATDVQSTGTAGKTTPDPLAVPTATQIVALTDLVASLTSGVTMLGTYDASTSQIAAATTAAAAGGRSGFLTAGKLTAGAGMMIGDYMLVSQAGTPAGDAAAGTKALAANDHLVWTGSAWHLIGSGYVGGPVTVHQAADVTDAAVQTVIAANIKGILVRDSSVAADGTTGAYKLVDVLDLGMF